MQILRDSRFPKAAILCVMSGTSDELSPRSNNWMGKIALRHKVKVKKEDTVSS
jgi:hypothetical protein